MSETPFKDVKLQRENNEKMRILTREEEIALLNAIKTSSQARHLEPIVITALNTGMRKGEILGLRWEAVNFKEGYIVLENTKNSEIRKITMNRRLTETLINVKRLSIGEFVFADRNGHRFGDIKTEWWHAVKNAGAQGLRFHDMRHAFASRLVMAGVDLATVKELMGHKDIKTTLRYSHPTPQHKRAAVRILDEITTVFTTHPETETLDSLESMDK